jgi:hypothetical protein
MKKIATRFAECLLVAGMIYGIVVLTVVPARAAACDCAFYRAHAGELCYSLGHADGRNVPEDGQVIFCSGSNVLLLCEDGSRVGFPC